MIVSVTAGAAPALLEPDNLKAFKIVLGPGLQDEDARRAAFAGVAEPISATEAWVSAQWVRQAAGREASPEWRAGFEAMLGYARQHGWVRETDGAIRAHIEQAH